MTRPSLSKILSRMTKTSSINSCEKSASWFLLINSSYFDSNFCNTDLSVRRLILSSSITGGGSVNNILRTMRSSLVFWFSDILMKHCRINLFWLLILFVKYLISLTIFDEFIFFVSLSLCLSLCLSLSLSLTHLFFYDYNNCDRK